MRLRVKTSRPTGFGGDKRGTTAVEFAIVGPIIFALMFWLTDVGFALYAQNSFNHAVNTVAREVYVDPDLTQSEIQAQLTTELSRFGDNITTTVTTETVGSLDYRIIDAQMDYTFKAPPFSGRMITLNGKARAPIIKYQLEESEG